MNMNNMCEKKFICFLDIDGVLNSQEYFTDRRDQESDKWEDDIDSRAILWLNDFLGEDGVVVITSTWRLSHSVETIRGIFENRGFTGNIIDSLPSVNRTKYHLINCWLNENIPEVDFNRYVVFDDEQIRDLSGFFLVDNYFGISPNTFLRAKIYLKHLKNNLT